MVWWSFELLVLLSGLLPNPKLETAVFSISMNLAFIAFMVPLGLSATISTRVSNELGAGQPEAARLATRVIMIVSLSVCAAEGLAVLLARNIWGLAYSNNEEVIKYTVIVYTNPCSRHLSRWLAGCTVWCYKGLWSTKDRCLHQHCFLLHCWHSFSIHLCLFVSPWWKGTLVRTDVWNGGADGFTSCDYSLHQLG